MLEGCFGGVKGVEYWKGCEWGEGGLGGSRGAGEVRKGVLG